MEVKKNNMITKIFLLFFCFFILNSTYAQSKNNVDYFLLGTLSDYMGRQKCITQNEIVDHYFKFEKSLLNYNYNILKNQYPDLKMDTINNALKSKILTDKINGYFNFSFDDQYCTDVEDTNGNLKDTLFTGKLKPTIFKSDKDKISYLIGVFTRHGTITDSEYAIKIANSVSTYEISKMLLQQLDCKIIEAKVVENVPYFYSIKFIPNKILNKEIKKYMFLRNKLSEDETKIMKQLEN